jgi:hypothetical protein
VHDFLHAVADSDPAADPVRREWEHVFVHGAAIPQEALELRGLFIEACGLVGVEGRPAGTSVRIYRRASVAVMREHVGIKN